MEVRSVGTASIATQSDRFAGLDGLVLFHEMFTHVAVESLQAVGVTDDDILAIALAFVLHHTHLAVEGSAYGIAHIHLDVGAVVLSAEAGTIAKVACHQSAVGGHMESPQVDAVFLGQRNAIVADVFIVP